MNKYAKKRSIKAGLPPGSPVYIGEPTGETLAATLITYDESAVHEQAIDIGTARVSVKDQPGVSWLNVEGVHRVDILQKLGDCCGLHPLVLEDIVNTEQRPKLEDYGEYLYIVVRMLSLSSGTGRVMAEQVSLVLGSGYVLSFQEGIAGDLFDPLREHLRAGKGRARRLGADYLVYSLLDAIVDNYFAILEGMGERIELLQEELVASPGREIIRKYHHLKRDVINLRRSIWPLREVISSLERRESHLVSPDTVIYLRDVYDHTVQIIDTIETFRDMLSGMMDLYLTSVSNRTNEVMKVLTIIATIFMPLTFIVGLYGMNFKHMPELEWHWGYPAVLLLMALISIGMVVFFKRKKWM
jgi:magnesium transporter